MIDGSSRKKVGLVLGGGGARGLAHIGVLKVLEREKIPIDCLAGTSMGGLIGAFFAYGTPVQAIESEAVRLGKMSRLIKFADPRISRMGATLKGTRIYNYLSENLGAETTFQDLKIPTILIASDLITGQEVTMSKGLVIDAIRATISVPGVFMPVDLNNCRLVDGGVLNNVPVDAARQLGADVVVAVNVLPDFSKNQPGKPPTTVALEPSYLPKGARDLWHVEMVMISAMTRFRLDLFKPEILIEPILPADISLLYGFHRAEEAILHGEQAAEQALPALRALLA